MRHHSCLYPSVIHFRFATEEIIFANARVTRVPFAVAHAGNAQERVDQWGPAAANANADTAALNYPRPHSSSRRMYVIAANEQKLDGGAKSHWITHSFVGDIMPHTVGFGNYF